MAERYQDMLRSLSAKAAEIHPANDPEQWSACLLVEHLILAYRGTERTLADRLEKGRPTRATLTEEHRTRQQCVFSTGSIPMRGKAPDAVAPGPMPLVGRSGVELSRLLREDLLALDRQIDSAQSFFGDQPIASHHLLGPLSAEQWREFHSIHSRHHLPQMERIVHAAVE